MCYRAGTLRNGIWGLAVDSVPSGFMKPPPFLILGFAVSFFHFTSLAQSDSLIIRGRVQDHAGMPLEGMPVTLNGVKTTGKATVFTDREGSYTLRVVTGDLWLDSLSITAGGVEALAGNGNRYLAINTGWFFNPHDLLNDRRWIFQLTCATCQEEIPMPEVLFHNGYSLLVNDSINAKDSLEYLVNLLSENPTVIIEIGNHTDIRGDERPNEMLSRKRAEACLLYLLDRGIQPDRVVAKGYGETEPIVGDEEISKLATWDERENAHRLNERTVFRVLSIDHTQSADK